MTDHKEADLTLLPLYRQPPHVVQSRYGIVGLAVGNGGFALRGMGDAGANGGPAGDVIVMVTVRPSEVFQRDGYDVWVTVPITYSQAVLGDSITVPSIVMKVLEAEAATQKTAI